MNAQWLNESPMRAFYRKRYYERIGKYFLNSDTPNWDKVKPTGFWYYYGRGFIIYMVGSILGACFALYLIISVLFGR